MNRSCCSAEARPTFCGDFLKERSRKWKAARSEIKDIVREPGARSKVAVTSNVPNVDPVGTLIGGRGTRVQAVNSEIGEAEKIDIITWDPDPQQYIINALEFN